MASGGSNVSDLPISVPVGGCAICDNRPCKDATWAEQFHLTEKRLQYLAKCNEKTDGFSKFQDLVDILTSQTRNDVEQFWVLFHWVQLESRRQHAQSRRSLSVDSDSDSSTVKVGRRSYGYAALYQKLCSTAGLTCKTVIGLCKSIGDRAEGPSAEQGNFTAKSWNVVTVDKKRALVDCEFELNSEANQMPPRYFMAHPKHFATTHFPHDESHQLLQVSVTKGEFRSHDSCLASSPRGETAAEDSPVTETKEESQTSGNPQEGESMEDHDRDLKLEDLDDSRLKPLPEGCTHHIMISYSRRQQKTVRKIKEHLDKVGYRVWMEDTMASSKLKAIKEAAIVLIAFSEDYTKSERRNREASYARKRKKGIVPVKMTDYEPDDWLYMVIGEKLYIDVSPTQAFSDKMKQLEVQIESKLAKLPNIETVSPVKTEAKPDETKEERQTSGNPQKVKPLPKDCNHHIMISYSWRQQMDVRKIKKHLDKAGYEVWVDEVNMEGTIPSCMAKAINEAAIVLIAFSDDYTKSENCKREAFFAQKHKKGIVLVKMTDYEPHDWLDMVIGKIGYIDFSSSQSFSDKMKQLEVHIEDSLAERETV